MGGGGGVVSVLTSRTYPGKVGIGLQSQTSGEGCVSTDRQGRDVLARTVRGGVHVSTDGQTEGCTSARAVKRRGTLSTDGQTEG